MDFEAAVDILRIGGPWGVVVFLGFALYLKDKQNQTLVLRIVQLVESNATSNVKVEYAVNGLKELIAAIIKK